MSAQPLKPIAFLFPAFPVLHQTFVLWEVLALRRLGVALKLYSLKRPSTRSQQPEGAALAPEVCYLPRTVSWQVLRANVITLARSPRRYLSAFGYLTREWWQDRHVKSLWLDKSTPADPAERMLTRRERAERFFNQDPVLYLLKSWWLVPRAVHLGYELQVAGISRVHAHWASYPATVALVIRWVFGIPFSFTAHAYDIYLVPQLLPVKVRTAEFVVTCARVNANYLEALGGAAAHHKIIVNYHGVDLDRFQPRSERPGSDVPCIVTCGRLQLYKGHHVLLRACAALNRPLRCIVIGEGPQRATLEQLARSLGIADRIEFTGPLPQNEVARLYGQADVFVLSSVIIVSSGKRDVIPNVLAEAMAMHLPVIASNVSGIGELIADGASGRLVAPSDPLELAAVLDELLRDEAQRRRLAAAGYRKVVAEFDRKKNIEALGALFSGTTEPRTRALDNAAAAATTVRPRSQGAT